MGIFLLFLKSDAIHPFARRWYFGMVFWDIINWYLIYIIENNVDIYGSGGGTSFEMGNESLNRLELFHFLLLLFLISLNNNFKQKQFILCCVQLLFLVKRQRGGGEVKNKRKENDISTYETTEWKDRKLILQSWENVLQDDIFFDNPRATSTIGQAGESQTIWFVESAKTKCILNVIILFFHWNNSLAIRVPEAKERRLPWRNNLICLFHTRKKKKVKKKKK